MIENSDFELTQPELERLNTWATEVARGMCQSETESWVISVIFSFSNWGNRVEATCGLQDSTPITIRD